MPRIRIIPTEAAIGCGWFDVIDHDHIAWTVGGLEPQPQLLVQGGEDRIHANQREGRQQPLLMMQPELEPSVRRFRNIARGCSSAAPGGRPSLASRKLSVVALPTANWIGHSRISSRTVTLIATSIPNHCVMPPPG